MPKVLECDECHSIIIDPETTTECEKCGNEKVSTWYQEKVKYHGNNNDSV